MHHLVIIPAGDDPDLAADALWQAGAVGVEDLGDALRGAFEQEAVAVAVAARFSGALAAADDHTGLDAWRAHAAAHRAGPFRVRPPWIEAETGPIDLVIDPQRAFGSGSHPSTRLALDLIGTVVGRADTVLDVGTGSGVLAIGAALLGAAVDTLDTDLASTAAVHANAAANHVIDRVSHQQANACDAVGRYSLALCNMTIDLHELIGARLAEQTSIAHLIVSGILAGDQEQRAIRAHHRTAVVERRVEGEWAALLLA